MNENRKLVLGILVAVLVFGLSQIGCSTPPKYYNLGNASEENCSLIQVDPVSAKSAVGFSYTMYPSIDGERQSWTRSFMGSKSVVRVTPGSHTFTFDIFKEGLPTKKISLKYDCEAGKGYSFKISGEGTRGNIVRVSLSEAVVDEKGNFADFSGPLGELNSNLKVVAMQTEKLSEYLFEPGEEELLKGM